MTRATDSRVVMLSDYFGDGGAATGGGGIAALDSYLALAGLGVEVGLIAGFHLPPGLGERPGVQLLGGRDLRAGSPRDALAGLYNPASARALAQALEGYDAARTVVVLHQWTRFLSPSAIALLSRFKLMIYMHDYFWVCPNGAYYDFAAGRPCAERPLSLGCATSACDRAGALAKGFRLARHAVKAVATGGRADDRLFLHLSDTARAVAEPLLPGERHRRIYNAFSAAPPARDPGPPLYDVGYFGRLEPEKGVGDLVEALEAKGWRGLFVGDGSLRARVGAASRVQLTPWLGHADTLALMRRCRVVVLPSRWPETWGLVVAEALAQGVKVVVSQRAGSCELVRKFGGGEVFDPAEPGGLARAIAAALARADDDPGRARRVRDLLSPASHGRRLLALAEEAWGLELAGDGAAISAPAARSLPTAPARPLAM